MAGFIESIDRGQTLPFPDQPEDWIGGDHPDRVADVFVDELDLSGRGFFRSAAARICKTCAQHVEHCRRISRWFIGCNPTAWRNVA